ncbi:hypothetical protein ACQ4PT_032113 [Festuca glaucescens]
MPIQYVVREHNDQQLAAAVTAPVPVIDLSRLFELDGAGDEATKLRSALDSWGLILFQFEGYGNDRVRSPDQILDWTDRVYLKVEPEDERSIALWPAHPETFRMLCTNSRRNAGGVKDSLLRAMAKLLELHNDDYFIDQLGDRASTHARCSYYPECPRPELVFGLKPHCNGTVVTVIMVDDTVGGLQVLRDGVWWDVPVVPHTLMVIIGDQTQMNIWEKAK